MGRSPTMRAGCPIFADELYDAAHLLAVAASRETLSYQRIAVSLRYRERFAGVAQLVERQLPKQRFAV